MRLSQEVSRLRRVKSPLSIIMLGIDNVERLIDNYGSTFKDNTLVKIGSAIKRIIRFNDLPCRYEGDKFSIILPDTAALGAKSAAEKILENVQKLSFKNVDEEVKVSVSMAINQFKVNMNLNQFIEEAEGLLTQAQEQGGNQILISSAGQE
jgi:diguanylate cyclase (GGDEF)-like protein